MHEQREVLLQCLLDPMLNSFLQTERWQLLSANLKRNIEESAFCVHMIEKLRTCWRRVLWYCWLHPLNC